MDVALERQKINGGEREREIENEREGFKEKVNVGKNSKVLVMKLKSISKESAQNFKYGIDNVAN